MEMLMHYQDLREKIDDCIIAGDGEGGVMESREKKL